MRQVYPSRWLGGFKSSLHSSCFLIWGRKCAINQTEMSETICTQVFSLPRRDHLATRTLFFFSNASVFISFMCQMWKWRNLLVIRVSRGMLLTFRVLFSGVWLIELTRMNNTNRQVTSYRLKKKKCIHIQWQCWNSRNIAGRLDIRTHFSSSLTVPQLWEPLPPRFSSPFRLLEQHLL